MSQHAFTRRLATIVAIVCSLSLSIATVATADQTTAMPGRVLLKSGGVLTGQITTEKNPENGRSYVTVQKEDGSVIKLDRSRLVRKIELASAKTFEYERLAAAAKSVDDHRKILNWCLDQPGGRRVFESRIELHANRILQTLPDDTQARKTLGYERGKSGGWIQREQYFAEHGYTRDGTSWTPIRAALIKARREEVDDRVAEKKELLRKWLRAAKRGELDRDDLEKSLFSFCDQHAIREIEKAAKRENSPALRSLMIDGIGQVKIRTAMRILVAFAMNDPDIDVRERALTLLGQPHYDAQAASRMFAEVLTAKNVANKDINRAAYAIGELRGTSVIGELIDSLITTHTEKNPNSLGAGRLNPTFTSDGGAGLATGGGPQTITITRQNNQVLNALKSLTEQNFEYDIEQWQSWHIEANTYHDVNVRRD